MKDVFKEFKPTSWSIDNKTSIYIITVIIAIAGIFSYNSLPKEQFPEVVFPQMYVATVYQGVSPTNIENLVTKQIEKQVKSIAGVKKVTSNSVQDFSNVIVEFNTDVDIAVAKQKVKDAVDKARTDLPNDLTHGPDVIEIDVSQLPIMNVNISGDYDLVKLKDYADQLKDRIETLPEITRVDIVGALDREVQVNVDVYKMMAANISFMDIENAIAYENNNITGGQIAMDGLKRTLTVNGQYKDAASIGNIIVRGASGAIVSLKDIAEVKDDFKEKESFARLNGKNVITLNVIKRSGENLIEASDKIRTINADMEKNVFPKGLKTTITGDQSDKTRTTLHDLINTIIIGFILVTVILMFFMGTTNALFVAMSVPLSMCVAFLVMPAFGFTLNMIVLFAFLLALGIVVDDAIVVVENTHRIFDNGKVPIVTAAKNAAGEVFLPVLSGTLTTLAPFIPLAFWQGVIGKFMFYLPVTLIITLLASLVVAYIINPVFAVQFMKPHDDDRDNHKKIDKGFKITAIVFAVLALIAYLINFGLGNFVVTLFAAYALNKFVLTGTIRHFQEDTWPKVQNFYKKIVTWAIDGAHPYWILGGTVGLLFFSVFLMSVRSPKVVFFPQSDPNFIYTYIRMPIGTDQKYTDSITQVVEKRVAKVVGDSNPIVQSIIANVGIGASENQMDGGTQVQPHLGKVTVAFVDFADRHGENTRDYLDKIREAVKGIAGAEISVDQEKGGPPTGKPINIEIAGDNFDELVTTSTKLKRYLDSLHIGGVEELKSDFQADKPEIVIDINRERAGREGITTGQIGREIRTAVFGWEASKFRDDKDDYPIQVRLREGQRGNIDAIMNMKITYRDMTMGGAIRQVPLSSVADIKYSSSYAGIKRKDQKRLVTLASNVLSGYNANEVVAELKGVIADFQAPPSIMIKMTGEQEDQAETGAFLGRAMLISLGLIFLILVTQFNSLSKPIIILSEIIFSIIGVLLGFSIFKMDMSIIMTGIGIVALAGIVVRNGILLVEFTDLLMEQGMGLKEAIIEAGRTRMTPVLLTACATMLGLVPLAVGLNIDFVKLFTELNPHIYFGGDSVAFWGPLSWTMIFGLSFATFLTLILVPVMYYLVFKFKVRVSGWFGGKKETIKHEREHVLVPVEEVETI
ncbi:efflux RND transporter permease subunit [Solitalea koreensis]|uniref:Multidrug efflux pump subunit AcrB n=1 Tax=Solitalea koreensis TaxID=543615 RepID=A0A521E197_9SPHI|nr:efflux RND transporter permease subunit [Solitalea koreensis]SMO77743.1 Multidrug efflux pump subunit AcrB [Solitalea koreensis]